MLQRRVVRYPIGTKLLVSSCPQSGRPRGPPGANAPRHRRYTEKRSPCTREGWTSNGCRPPSASTVRCISRATGYRRFQRCRPTCQSAVLSRRPAHLARRRYGIPVSSTDRCCRCSAPIQIDALLDSVLTPPSSPPRCGTVRAETVRDAVRTAAARKDRTTSRADGSTRLRRCCDHDAGARLTAASCQRSARRKHRVNRRPTLRRPWTDL